MAESSNESVAATCDALSEPCPVCCFPFTNPIQLPCQHVFCFTCAKGFINRSKMCALCRQPTPTSYLSHPVFIKMARSREGLRGEEEEGEICWFYKCRGGGWWRYESKQCQEIEERYQEDAGATFDLLLAGYMYTINLKDMVQHRRSDPNVQREIKRALPTEVTDLKGEGGSFIN